MHFPPIFPQTVPPKIEGTWAPSHWGISYQRERNKSPGTLGLGLWMRKPRAGRHAWEHLLRGGGAPARAAPGGPGSFSGGGTWFPAGRRSRQGRALCARPSGPFRDTRRIQGHTLKREPARGPWPFSVRFPRAPDVAALDQADRRPSFAIKEGAGKWAVRCPG